MSTQPSTDEQAPAETAPARRRTIVERYLRTCPGAVVLALIVIVTSLTTGTIATPGDVNDGALSWATGVTTTVQNGQWWTPLTALFVPNDLVQLIVCVLAALVLFALAERLMGSLRAAIAFLVTGVLGMIVGVLLQAAAMASGDVFTAISSLDVVLDPTVGIVGALITASAFASALWRRRIRVTTFAIVLMFVLYNGDSDNFYRLVAGLLGLGLGAWLARGHAPHHGLRRSSLAESRNLIAVIVAVTGLGPIIAFTNGGGFGALSFLATMFTTPDYSGQAINCQHDVGSHCNQALSLAPAPGVGGILLALAPLALLLVAAWGLRKGRRFAYLMALVINVALFLFAFAAMIFGNITIDAKTPAEVLLAVEAVLWLLASVLVPLVVIAILALRYRNFQVRAPRRAVIRFCWTIAAAFVVLAAFYLIVGGVNLGTYSPKSTFGALLADAVRRFIPTGFNNALGGTVTPHDPFTLIVYRWVGVVFWIVFILATLQLYRATHAHRHPEDEEHFRALLKRGGGGTLGFMGTWPDNVYWFTDDGEGAVAYRVINGVAITLSDPVCDAERATETVHGFVDFCTAHSWTPVFYSIHEQYLPIFDDLGWQHMSVGEETLMHPPTLELTGKAWQKVRQPLNRITKEGVTTVWTRWEDLTVAMANRINAISEQWVSEKELPEMGFTLGALEELKDPEVALYLAIDAGGGIQAITSWMPSYRDGRVVGYTIDFMRRGDNAMNGIMEFIIISAALKMKEDGVEVLSLSGAPLATKPTAPDAPAQPPNAMTQLLGFLAKILEPAYGFSSLFRFKSKFNPVYETIYMAYPDPLALPTIGMAIGKAYLPHATPKEYVALARTLTGR